MKMTRKQKNRRRKWRNRLFNAMTPIEGEVRTVARCVGCNQYVGRRYIPHAIGRGGTWNMCPCMMTNNAPNQRWDNYKEKSP